MSVRLVWVIRWSLLVALLVPLMAQAKVEPFVAARGSEAMAYLGPELARAVESTALSLGAELNEPVVGRLEDLGESRVRLSAAYRGYQVIEEGPLEELDAIAARLGTRLAVLAPPSKHAHPKAQLLAKLVGAGGLGKSEVAKSDGAKTEVAKSDGAKTEVAKTDAAKTDAKIESKSDPVKTEVAKVDPVKTEVKTEAKSDPLKSETKSEVKTEVASRDSVRDPFKSDAVKDDARNAAVFHPRRVVAHQVADYPGVYGAGWSATQALNGFLRNRLRVQISPGGVGLAPISIANEEATRADARAVIMVRILSLEPIVPGGPPKSRIEVVVVQNGRAALHRTIEAMPADPGAFRRPRGYPYDPVFLAVTQALESLSSELFQLLDS